MDRQYSPREISPKNQNEMTQNPREFEPSYAGRGDFFAMPHAEMDRERLLLQLTEVEFACIDMQLYLDTHPCDKAAIRRYNALTAEAKTLRAEFEQRFEPLLSYISPSSDDYFSWIDDPWTWDTNFLAPQKAGSNRAFDNIDSHDYSSRVKSKASQSSPTRPNNFANRQGE